MKAPEVSLKTVKLLPGEDIVDAGLLKLVRETCKERHFSRWALLTRSTDRIRLAAMAGASNLSLDLAATFHAPLRCGFRAVAKLADAGQMPDKPHFSEAQGASFNTLIDCLHKYDQLSRLYSLVHNGLLTMEKTEELVRFASSPERWPLEVFQVMDNRPPSVTSLLYFMEFLSRDPQDYARMDPDSYLESRILHSTSRAGRYRVRYAFDVGIIREFTDHFMPGAGICPDNWSCAGFAWPSIRKFNAALMAISYYQTVAAFGGARLHRTVGLGDNQAVLIQNSAILKSLIRKSAGLDEGEVNALFDIYTYDDTQSWADPTLTPLIPLQRDRFALDPALAMLSNWERNTLKLLARSRTKEFDSVSGTFEKMMLSRMSKTLAPLLLEIRTGITINGEEIDLLAFDPNAGVVLIIEAKWEIRASDPIEMVRARESAIKKHDQLSRKVKVLTQNIDRVADVFGRKGDAVTKCVAAVILEGNKGLPRSSTLYPVVPSGALESAVSISKNLLEAYNALDSFSWTPKLGEDYEVEKLTIEFAGLKFESEGSRIMWENFGQRAKWSSTPHFNMHFG